MVLLQCDPALCPRLLDYVVVVGARVPNRTGPVSQTPEILRRYPPQDHSDFPLPPDVVFFCQPEGCFSSSHRRLSMREVTSFVFTLTEKDSGRVRYGICLNFYRPIERRQGQHNGISGGVRHGSVERTESMASTSSSEAAVVIEGVGAHAVVNQHHPHASLIVNHQLSQQAAREHKPRKTRPRTHTLTSLCMISHHPFFSKFRQALHVLKKIIERCHDRSKGGSRSTIKDTVWSVLTGASLECSNSLVMHDVREIETWILRLLSAPVPVPGKTRVQLFVLPEAVHEPLCFALPDRTRLSLVDFPLHLPLELLGVETCLRVLICIILEQKVVLQSRDYNSLTMSVMAFVAMLYPLQYMFPVIPLLPTCMTDAEQLLLAPTPFIIGIPASFLLYKKNFKLPNDVWLVDLDACKVIGPAESVPDLPEPEGTTLKNHLRQVVDLSYVDVGALTSMSSSPQPIHDLDTVANNPEFWRQKETFTNISGFNPLIYGNDVDSIDVATRVAMVRFLNSANMLANFSDHTRTLRFYPRPVVAFQYYTFIKSRPADCLFVKRFARTQAVEYFGEWCLYPDNLVFQRIQTGIFDPLLIGDKPKWYSSSLQRVEFRVYRTDNCTIHHNWADEDKRGSDAPTDESGSDSDGIRSISSSYSSLNDFVSEMIDSGISGEAPELRPECHKLTVDLALYTPPKSLFIPEGAETSVADTSSSDEDEEEKEDKERPSRTSSGSSRLERQSSGVNRPPRPPPPTRAGSIGSHPGTPRSTAKVPSEHSSPSQSQQQPPQAPQTPPPPGQQPQQQQAAAADASIQSKVNEYGSNSEESPSTRSILSNIGDDLSDAAAQATHVFSELLGNKHSTPKATAKPYLPLGNRKALVEKSGITRNAMRRRDSRSSGSASGPSVDQRNNAISTDNQVFLKEVVKGIFEGKGVSLLNRNKVKKLMEDENYRAFVASKLNPNLEKKVTDADAHIDDVLVEKYPVFKGLVWILSAMISGLQTNCVTRGIGGMSSVFCLLEIAHTHYFQKESGTSARSDSSLNSSPFGSQESLAKRPDENQFVATVAGWWKEATKDLRSPSLPGPAASPLFPSHAGMIIPPAPVQHRRNSGQPLYFDGEEYENIEVTPSMPPADQESSDLLRDIVLKKGTGSSAGMPTALTSSGQTPSGGSRRTPPNSDGVATPVGGDLSASATTTGTLKSAFLSGKSKCSGQYRYHSGHLYQIQLSDDHLRVGSRTYIFEAIINRERSRLWDNMQFWEDAFLDTVAQEREIVGMDLSPSEMIDRYTSLGVTERRRLEADEDRLLGTILYNMISFMVMMRVDKTEIRKKIRRLVAKSHIGLARSQEIYNLLDNLEHLNGNGIDMRPLTSRFMQKQSFSVRRGSGNTGDMLFMEVCDDCLVLRSVTSYIVERWWFEKIVSVTFSPKSKVLCLWVKEGNQTNVNQFYTKRCKELYQAVEEAMERATCRVQDKQPPDGVGGRDSSGKFPVQDLVSGDGGLLQVCMEGIGLIFQNNKFFIELSHIKSCCTQKDDIFLIEEWDPILKEMNVRRFRSKMSKQICYSVLSSISSFIAQHSASTPPTSFNRPFGSSTRLPVLSPPTDTMTSTATVHASLAHS